ncbi:MAG: sulfite exporter TauE/SafE family protein [Bacteroidales bacterium]|nr:sulfite exporter TauE/SafE family protein [Bacteroidales bacterium]
MGEVLNGLLENSSMPFFTALVLGLMTAISPCPLATNITAIGFIGKDIENRNRVFVNGLVYTLGRAITYTLIALVIFLGADQFSMSGVFQKYGEKIIGPLLIVIGLFMLDILKIKLPGFYKLTQRFGEKGTKNYWDVLMLGILFALAFCPYSAVMYFGMLIPITITSPAGLYLPVVFAIATAVPVIIFAWLIAFTVSKVGVWYNNLKIFEIWFRRFISIVFIGVGVYYVITIYS